MIGRKSSQSQNLLKNIFLFFKKKFERKLDKIKNHLTHQTKKNHDFSINT